MNDWYNWGYTQEIIAPGPFHTAYRYAAAFRESGRRHFLQLFETDSHDPAGEIEHFLSERQLGPERGLDEEVGPAVFTPV